MALGVGEGRGAKIVEGMELIDCLSRMLLRTITATLATFNKHGKPETGED